MSRRYLLIPTLLMLPALAQAPGSYEADVVVIVDTSTSMKRPGLDPERASLLVAKLLSDISPGRLAVIRLLDLGKDKESIPWERTGQQGTCKESASGPSPCDIVSIPKSTYEKVKRERIGAETRPARGDSQFKKKLETHLAQDMENSMFDLAFMGAQGVFDKNQSGLPRSVIWLSDGIVDENPVGARIELQNLQKMGVDVRAIVFGSGNTEFAAQNGLAPSRASGPAQLVEAFTDAFRGIVKAPYKVHAPVASKPQFEMKRWIEEAWVVVYGDTSLGAVEIETPKGKVKADYAQDSWPAAGAYKVAYLKNPDPGTYKVLAAGGGGSVTYGVVQRSSVQPYYLGPTEANSGVPVRVVAGLRAVPNGPEIPESEFGEKVQMTLRTGGQTITLTDDGAGGDEKAGDGRYSAMLTVREPGEHPLEIRAKNSFLDRGVNASLRVTGHFKCRRCEETLDFGSFKAGGTVCRDLALDAERVGVVPFVLRSRKALPQGLTLALESGKQRGSPLRAGPGDPLRVCLVSGADAGASQGSGDPWAALTVDGRNERDTQVELRLRWDVRPLTFWERWGWLILTLLALAVLAWIIYGYIRPHRFAKELAVAFAPEYGDLDDQTPQPLKQWRDIKIGFYRDARAYFRPDYRISGKKAGAIAMLVAGPNRSAIAMPAGGNTLFRETSDADWEPVPLTGRRVSNGDIYRVGESGPHFRIAARLMR